MKLKLTAVGVAASIPFLFFYAATLVADNSLADTLTLLGLLVLFHMIVAGMVVGFTRDLLLGRL